MPNKRPVPLSELLQTGSLADLAAEAGRRESLTERIRGLLPPEEGAHLVTASQSDSGELMLIMDSSVWAARVRFRAKELGTDRIHARVLPKFD